MDEDSFGKWLAKQKCDTCGEQANHRQAGQRVCNQHIDPTIPAFALDD